MNFTDHPYPIDQRNGGAHPPQSKILDTNEGSNISE